MVERHRVTNMFTVPTILTPLTRDPAVDRHDHSSLRYVVYAGTPMFRADQQHALRKLGRVLVQYLGLGEVTGNITVLTPHLHAADNDPAIPAGTCGQARTGIEVEEVLMLHPAVAEACVVGMPHPKWGETGVAVLVPRDGARIDAAAVLAQCEGRLAKYKRPARVVVWDALPKSGYGKVVKAGVKRLLAEQTIAP